MDMLWNVLTAVITSFITTLVFNFFLHRMTENAQKPLLTEEHKQIIQALSAPNAIARVQLPNGEGLNYEVQVGSSNRFALPNQVAAFDEMVEHKIVVSIQGYIYRLSRNFSSKYRKSFPTLVLEEFWRHRTERLSAN